MNFTTVNFTTANFTTMNSARYLYGGFSCRDTLETTIHILREEGFKTQDLEVLVGIPTRASAALQGAHPVVQNHDWFAGVPATVAAINLRTARWSTLFPWKLRRRVDPVTNYLSRGGLLLSITTWSDETREVALEVLEDAGAERIEGREKHSTVALPTVSMIRPVQHSAPFVYR